MDIEKVKELVALMVDNNLSSISLRNGSEEITVKRPDDNGSGHPVVEMPPQVMPMQMQMPMSVPVAVGRGEGVEQLAASDEQSAPALEEKMVTITSPMVGTFYAAPNPEAPPFVEIGSKVAPDTVVCIIEAMKVFNEIPAEVVGTVEKILVSNQHPVDYGQPLFLVRPD